MQRFARKLTAVTLLMSTGPTAADVIYSGLQDTAIPTTYQGIDIDVDGVGGWDLNPFMGGVYLYNNTAFQPVRDGTDGMDTVLNLTAGSTVNSSLNYASGTGGSLDHLGTQFTAGNEGYLGFRLNGSQYGWMRVVFTNNNGGALIKDWAYIDSGTSIAVGNVVQNGTVFTVNSSAASFTLGSQITGGNSLVKTGSNITTLTGNNSYTGTTSINIGTLALAAGASLSGTSAVTVAAGATLSGLGSIAGTTTIEGFHSPGNGPGLQTFEDGLSYLNDSTLLFELTQNALGIRGTDFDGIDVGGTLSIASGVTSSLIFNGSGSDVVWEDDFWDTSHSWVVLESADSSFSLNSVFSDITVSEDSMGEILAETRGIFTWTAVGDDVLLVYTAIPEPSTALLGGLSALLLLRRRR